MWEKKSKITLRLSMSVWENHGAMNRDNQWGRETGCSREKQGAREMMGLTQVDCDFKVQGEKTGQHVDIGASPPGIDLTSKSSLGESLATRTLACCVSGAELNPSSNSLISSPVTAQGGTYYYYSHFINEEVKSSGEFSH